MACCAHVAAWIPGLRTPGENPLRESGFLTVKTVLLIQVSEHLYVCISVASRKRWLQSASHATSVLPSEVKVT